MTRPFRFTTFLFLSVLFLLLAGVVGWKGYQKYLEKERVSVEVLRLREEADRIKSETERLDERIAYMRTPEYADREIKEKLNLKNPEESVAIVRPGTQRKEEERKENIAEVSRSGVSPSESIPKKWWNFFFSPEEKG